MRKWILGFFSALFITGTTFASFASVNQLVPEAVAVIQDGWTISDAGWSYYKDGTKQTGWLLDDNFWYYMDQTGLMQTGWKEINGSTYYLYPDGHMAAGESLINGKMYTFTSEGAYQYEGIKRAGLDDATITSAVEQYHQNYPYIIEAYNKINTDRNSRGLSTLELNQDMCIASIYRGLHMHQNGYYAHFTNDIDHANEAFQGYTGIFVDISENLNRGTLKTKSYTPSQWIDCLHDGLLESEYHALNILRPPYKRVGVGVVVLDDGKTCYLTQMFTDRTDF